MIDYRLLIIAYCLLIIAMMAQGEPEAAQPTRAGEKTAKIIPPSTQTAS